MSAGIEDERMPVVFIGHGNPMNALRDTPFTRSLRRLGEDLPRPKTILCVSAHWMSEGTFVTHMEKPRTIHDFHGFPEELFAVQYPARGDPQMADHLCTEAVNPEIHPDDDAWGIDHGTWSVLKHMYPKADIPVIQLSIYMAQPSKYHFALGQRLRKLRDEGVLIVGSGNIVHNLRRINFDDNASPYDWAIEFDAWVKQKIENRDYGAITHEATQSAAGKLSIPTPDHWYPLLYTLGAADEKDGLRFEYEGIENASISMRCLSLGRS